MKTPLVKASQSQTGKPAPAQMPLCPPSAVICSVFSVILVVVATVVLFSAETVERVVLVEDHFTWHARSAMLLIIQSTVLELCILISSYTAVGIAGEDLKPTGGTESQIVKRKEQPMEKMDLAQHNFGDSCLIMLEYIFKFFTALHFMQKEGVMAYRAPLSPDRNRAVFPVRFLQWSFGVPFLVLISNRAFLAGKCSEADVLLRSAPSLVLTVLYCLASCVMEVATSLIARNLLIVLIMASYIAVCADQIVVAFSVPGVTARRMKMLMLCYQLLTFTVYSVVYFVAYFGYMSCTLEQSLYTYMDATVKVLHGCLLAMVRNYEDIRVIRLWWTESVAARRDFERLVEQARVPIFTLDLEGRVTSWNASLAQLTRLPAESVEGTPAATLLKKECREGFQQALNRPITAASCSSLELIFRKDPWSDNEGEQGASGASGGKQGSNAILIMSVVNKLSRDGKLEGYVGIGQDISEMCELRAVEQKKAQLMAVVSHELRSPLHGMIGLTNMMEQSAQDGNTKRQLGMVRCCASRLLDLVTNIMEMTESEQRQRKGLGSSDIRRGLVNFLEVADEVSLMTSAASDKAGKPLLGPDVQLRNLLPELEDFPAVIGDPYKCTQLLYNLVTNACKFTQKGSVTLRARHRKDTSTLELHIEDTGAGISPDALERVFKPFEQDHRSTADARSFQGMGLGLAVCKEVVRVHGGTISASSQLGVGTTITVALPCENQYVDRQRKGVGAPQAAAGAAAPAPAVEANGKLATVKEEEEDNEEHVRADAKPLVLSVDDCMVNQEVVEGALSDACDVKRVMDGASALDFLSTRTKGKLSLPDVILLDIQMPGLTGFDVLAEIRKKYSHTHTMLPVIMVSAKAPIDNAALRSYSDGCSDFLAKPFKPELLKAKVDVALTIKREIKDHTQAFRVLTETARISQETAKSAASYWEETAEAAKAELGQTQQRLDKAEQSVQSAAREAAEATARATDMERELADLRKELQQARSVVASEASTAASFIKVAAPEDGPAGGGGAWAPQPRRMQLLQKVKDPLPESSVYDRQGVVPWLYAQLADREQEIVTLSEHLAVERSSKALASQQLNAMVAAASHAKELLDAAA